MEQAVLKKLLYKEGQAQATVLNAPEGYQLGIGGAMEGKFDFVLLYVRSKGELETWLPKTVSLLNDDAIFWISYPKQSSKIESDLNRDILNDAVRGLTSYRAVTNVAIDDKWSALRFRLAEKVKSQKS